MTLIKNQFLNIKHFISCFTFVICTLRNSVKNDGYRYWDSKYFIVIELDKSFIHDSMITIYENRYCINSITSSITITKWSGSRLKIKQKEISFFILFIYLMQWNVQQLRQFRQIWLCKWREMTLEEYQKNLYVIF